MVADRVVFDIVLNDNNLWSLVSQEKKDDLLEKYLPSHLDRNDKEETVELLLSNRLNKFNQNLIDNIFIQLKLQKLSPDLIKILKEVNLLKNRARQIQEQEHQCKLFKQIIKKRKLLFQEAIDHCPDDFSKPFRWFKCKNGSSLRTRRNWQKMMKKKRRVKERYDFEMKHLFYGDQEKETTDEETDTALGDIKFNSNFYSSPFSKSLNFKTSENNFISHEDYFYMIKKHHRKRKILSENNITDPTAETESITLSDIINRVANESDDDLKEKSLTRFETKYNSSLPSKTPKPTSSANLNNSNLCSKKKNRPTISVNKVIPPLSLVNLSSPKKMNLDTNNVKKEPMDVFDFDNDSPPHSFSYPLLSLSSSNSSSGQMTPFSLNIIQSKGTHIAAPLPALPTSTATETANQLSIVNEKPPACFFSLLRDIFAAHASNDYKLTLHKLEELVKEKIRSYDPNLGWSHEMVQPAMNYLSGVLPPPEEIPLVDYKEKNQQWQWIGTDRDSDQALVTLYKEWEEEKDKRSTTNLLDPSQPVPPPICPTDWTVRSSSEEEKKAYRDQEALRYNNPHKAFTFTVHSYTSVVGPVKGCGIGGSNSHTASPNKAREHSLLVNDRPPFVTLLSLVRDAAARLPNGEGTRADICQLLKDSQYLLQTVSDQQINVIVSGALDRLHYEKDPCVKYDVNRKVWIYLHRNRSEEEFERLHEVQVAAAKAKRSLTKAQRRANFSQKNSSLDTNSKPNSAKSFKHLSSHSSPNSEASQNSFNSNLTSLVQSTLSSSSSSTSLSFTSRLSSLTTISPSISVTSSSLAGPLSNSLASKPLETVIVPSESSHILSSSGSIKKAIKSRISKKETTLKESENITILPKTVKTVNFTNTLSPAAITAISLPNLANPQTSKRALVTSALAESNSQSNSQFKFQSQPHTLSTAFSASSSTPNSTSLNSITTTSGSANQPLSQSHFQTSQTLPSLSTSHSFLSSSKFQSPLQAEPQINVQSIRSESKNLPSFLSQPLATSQSITLSQVSVSSHSPSIPASASIQFLPCSNSNFSTHSPIQLQVQPRAKFQSYSASSASSSTSNSSNSDLTTPFANLPQHQISFLSQSPAKLKPESSTTVSSASSPSSSETIILELAKAPKITKTKTPKSNSKPNNIKTITSFTQQNVNQSITENIHNLINITSKEASTWTVDTTSKLTNRKLNTIASQTTSQSRILPRQVKVTSQTLGNATDVPATHQISIPTSVLFGTRTGSVVLAAPTGKSYMMATSGSSIVLHPSISTCSNQALVTSTATTSSSPLSVRPLQSIRVIPVSTSLQGQRGTAPIINSQITLATSTTSTMTSSMSSSSQSVSTNNGTVTNGPTAVTLPSHHVVARIITTGQAGNVIPSQAQFVIPSSSSLQPLLLAPAQQLKHQNE